MSSLTRRYAASAIIAVVVTFALFLGMQLLIAMGDGGLGDASKDTPIDFVRIRRQNTTRIRKRELPDRIKPQIKPPPPKLNLSTNSGKANGLGLTFAAPQSASFSMRGGPAGGIRGDREEVPVVRVRPMYPRAAAEKFIEGWVTVEFTINELGGVANPRVLASKPNRIFDRAAIQAIRKWKYKPKIVNGKAVSRSGITVKLSFNLGDE